MLLRKSLKFFSYTLAVIAVLAISLIAPIDRTPLEEQSFYQEMMKELDTLQLKKYPATKKLTIGWSEFNITPHYSMPMAGYTPKDKFDSVHDSLFCRVLYINNGGIQSFIISMDLMLFPPILKQKLDEYIAQYKKKYFLYLSATHTHSAIGGWDKSLVGRFTIGNYHEKWVESTAQEIIKQMEVAKQSSLPSSLHYWEADASELVQNRLDGNGKTDGWLRGIKMLRQDSSRAIVATFSGHPTTLDLLGTTLSGDYPAELVKQFKQEGYQFGMFMAGMMGSHRIVGFEGDQFHKTDSIAKTLAAKITHSKQFTMNSDSVSIISQHIPIQFGPSQLHLAKNWKARNWAFRSLLEPLKGEFTYLQIGNIIFMGTPCDFSGELYADADFNKWCEQNNKHLILTSFNGNYIGYVTADQHYDKNEEEVMALNWVGPSFGRYFTTCIQKIVSKNE